jgi:rod shape-determining protein MreC
MFADNRFGYLGAVRYGLGYATTPVYWAADIPTRVLIWVDDVFISRAELLQDNEGLREDLLIAQRELQLLESLASENSRLLELNNATGGVSGDVSPAEIINISPDPYSRRVLINKGSNEKVFLGQPLLDANGLMGQVVEVLPFTSWVLLITDPSHATPVEVNRNGERALARGARDNSSELDIDFVTQTQDMRAGDLLVSSGMGQIYPKNYPVAEIVSVYRDPGLDFATVRARPLAEMARTRHAMLVFPNSVRDFLLSEDSSKEPDTSLAESASLDEELLKSLEKQIDQ